MKTTEAVTSGVSSSRLTGWRPAWEGWSAAAGFAAAGTIAAMVPGWWGAGLASVLALMGVVRTAEALRTASRRIPLAGFAPAFIHARDLIRILREKGMDEKKAVDPVRKTAREGLVARYEAGRCMRCYRMMAVATPRPIPGNEALHRSPDTENLTASARGTPFPRCARWLSTWESTCTR